MKLHEALRVDIDFLGKVEDEVSILGHATKDLCETLEQDWYEVEEEKEKNTMTVLDDIALYQSYKRYIEDACGEEVAEGVDRVVTRLIARKEDK